jgi:hypothetical protein
MRKGSTKGNVWERDGGLVLIQLHEIKTKEVWWCYIDAADHEKVRKFRWHAKRFKGAPIPYAASSRRINGKCLTILMHRYITGARSHRVFVDHDNHNTLDNRRINLKKSTPSQNALNRAGLNSNNKTGIRGVHQTPSGTYTAAFRGKYIGSFDHLEDAAKAREFAVNCKADPRVARWL